MDNKELFMGPKTTQYGSHMVMTDVVKPTKTKYINRLILLVHRFKNIRFKNPKNTKSPL